MSTVGDYLRAKADRLEASSPNRAYHLRRDAEELDAIEAEAATEPAAAEPCYRCGEIVDGSLCAATGNREVCAAQPPRGLPPGHWEIDSYGERHWIEDEAGGSLTATAQATPSEEPPCPVCGHDYAHDPPRGVTPALDAGQVAKVLHSMYHANLKDDEPHRLLDKADAKMFLARLGSPEDSDAVPG